MLLTPVVTTLPPVAASYHVNVPLQPEADATAELGEHTVVPETIGAAGVVFGFASPEPCALVQPFTVCVTV